jgi:[ribosomal protein S5]-alanine N-acetyltransferase
MSRQPELSTERLFLRPFTLDDAPVVQKLAGDFAVAEMTLNIPYPYEDGMAEQWISTHKERNEKGELANFAVTLRDGGDLIGAIGLMIDQRHERAELGYWIGKPYWNKGYCTEAARAVVKFGFEKLHFHRIHASHFGHNEASGRVMQKIGMSYEGCFRQHVKKWDKFFDLKVYSILRDEFVS